MSGYCDHWDLVFGSTFTCDSVFGLGWPLSCLPRARIAHHFAHHSQWQCCRSVVHQLDAQEHVQVFDVDCRLVVCLDCSVRGHNHAKSVRFRDCLQFFGCHRRFPQRVWRSSTVDDVLSHSTTEVVGRQMYSGLPCRRRRKNFNWESLYFPLVV